MASFQILCSTMGTVGCILYAKSTLEKDVLAQEAPQHTLMLRYSTSLCM